MYRLGEAQSAQDRPRFAGAHGQDEEQLEEARAPSEGDGGCGALFLGRVAAIVGVPARGGHIRTEEELARELVVRGRELEVLRGRANIA